MKAVQKMLLTTILTMFFLGMIPVYGESLQELQKKAERGDASAQFNLGLKYDLGKSAPLNYQKAFKWYKKAAEQGNMDAQFNLGVMYDSGQGVQKNDKEAFKWYKKAAEQGDKIAQFNLGIMYNSGKGVLQNYIEAHKWANLSAYYGAKNGVKLRNTIEKKMAPKQVTHAQQLAQKWLNQKKQR